MDSDEWKSDFLKRDVRRKDLGLCGEQCLGGIITRNDLVDGLQNGELYVLRKDSSLSEDPTGQGFRRWIDNLPRDRGRKILGPRHALGTRRIGW